MLLIFFLFQVGLSSQCKPTPHLPFGPLYLPDAPYKENICPPSEGRHLYQASSSHPWLMRESISVQRKSGVNIEVRGRVLQADSCTPLANAELDVWQSDTYGVYGAMYLSSSDPNYGFCRGVVRTDNEGRFVFRTQEPGTYGLARIFVQSHYVPDLPPFGPRHLHVVVWHPRHEMLVTQLYFGGDEAARKADYRAQAAGFSLGSESDDLALNIADDGVVEYDFVLRPLAEGKKSFNNRSEAVRSVCTQEVPEFPPLVAVCQPNVVWLMRPEIVFATLIVSMVVLVEVLLYVVCCKCMRSSGNAKKKQN